MGGTDIRNLTPILIKYICEKNPDINFDIVVDAFQYSKLVSFIKCDNIKVDITMQVAVTGKTKTPRKMLETELKGYGIKCGGVSKKTTCVVCDETQSDSDKFVKAKELGIPIISEEEFRKKYL